MGSRPSVLHNVDRLSSESILYISYNSIKSVKEVRIQELY